MASGEKLPKLSRNGSLLISAFPFYVVSLWVVTQFMYIVCFTNVSPFNTVIEHTIILMYIYVVVYLLSVIS